MSDNNAHKRAARNFQAANPGMSYTRALRAVSNGQRRPLIARLGHDHAGKAVVVNLEPMSNGGSGPHCLITGDSQDVRALLAHLGDSLMTDQPKDAVDVIVVAAGPIELSSAHIRLDGPALVSHVDEIFEQRWRLLKSLSVNDIAEARGKDKHIPSVMVILDEHVPGYWLSSRPAQRWCRHGRSAGIHLIVGAQGGSPAGPIVDHVSETAMNGLLKTAIASTVLAALTTTISLYGGGRGTMRTPGEWQPEQRRPYADLLTDFTFTLGEPSSGSVPDADAG